MLDKMAVLTSTAMHEKGSSCSKRSMESKGNVRGKIILVLSLDTTCMT